MRITIRLFLFITVCTSCQNRNPYDCELDEEVIKFNDSILAAPDFQESINRHLEITNEPDLRNLNHSAFRLMQDEGDTYTREISYLLENSQEGPKLTYIRNLSANYNLEYGYCDTAYTRELNQSEWSNVKKAFESRCFWVMPVKFLGHGSIMNRSFLEAYDPNKENPTEKDYHFVYRSFPEDSTDFSEIIKVFESLVGEEW